MCPRDATNKIMSVAICFNCGSFKFGAFCSCEKCGALQESEDGSAITHLLNRLENQVSNQPSLARCQATLRTEFESTLSAFPGSKRRGRAIGLGGVGGAIAPGNDKDLSGKMLVVNGER